MENTGEIVITLASTEKRYPLERLSLTFDSTDSEVLDALQPVLLEEEGFNIREEQRDGYFTIKRVHNEETDTRTIYVFPKSTAGAL